MFQIFIQKIQQFSVCLFVIAFVFIGCNGTVESENTADDLEQNTPLMLTNKIAKGSGVNGSAIAVACGGNHTLLLKSDNTLWAAGYNAYGQLGNGNTTNSKAFIQVLANVAAMAAGKTHSLALKFDGTLWVTGRNDHGQLGTGNTSNKNTFTQVTVNGASSFMTVAAGDSFSLAVAVNGDLYGTGRNDHGQLGDCSTEEKRTFGLNPTASNVIKVVAGGAHSLVLKNDGGVMIGGLNDHGQLGLGSTDEMPPDLFIAGPFDGFGNTAIDIAAGESHSLILAEDGTVWVAGRNSNGELGNCSTSDVSAFTQNPYISNVWAVAAGGSHSMALNTDGHCLVTGKNDKGQLGTGDNNNWILFVIVLDNDICAIAAGESHSVALKGGFGGSVWMTGNNNYGQLGKGHAANFKYFGTQITLYSMAKYPNANGYAGANSSSQLYAQYSSTASEAVFDMMADWSSGNIVLYSDKKTRYVTASATSRATAASSSVGDWQRFTLNPYDSSGYTYYYLGANNGNGNYLNCNIFIADNKQINWTHLFYIYYK